MSSNKNNSIAKKALLEMEDVKASIKEESKNTLKELLSEAVKTALRESASEDTKKVDEDDEPEYEVQDETQTQENGADEPVAQEEPAAAAQEDVPAEEEPEAAQADDWAQFDSYKVGDDTYDLTGVEDPNEVVKVYKLLKGDDEVVVRKDGETITLKDNANDAEYVIDLGAAEEGEADAEPEAEVPVEGEEAGEELNEGRVFEIDLGTESMDNKKPVKENKKDTRKTMKESKKKEVIFEVDLGYTDNYQDKDPIAGLSAEEPSKEGRSWDEGLPKGTEKPWAGPSEKEGEPFDKTVNEEEVLTDDPSLAQAAEGDLEENVTTSKYQRRHAVKTLAPNSGEQDKPEVSKETSIEAQLKEMNEIKKENKELKESLLKLRQTLSEANMTNINLGKITKLFLENTTSQAEKVEIINRFQNEAKTKEQSMALYETISRELKKNVSVAGLNENVQSAPQTINENKVEKSKDLLQTIDLMNRVMSC